MNNLIWVPQPKQAEFMSRGEYEALYGGAAGGGKSDALIMEALRQVGKPQYRGLILRKTIPQLSELIDRSMILYGAAFPEARYVDGRKVWEFPSGAKIYFGSMQRAEDRFSYQGKRYDYIAFDELTHFTFEEYSYMFSRNRSSGKGMRCYIRAASNPGGVGHGWVKQRFIDAAEPGKTVVSEIPIILPDGVKKVLKRDRVFIPSSVFDNKALLESNPSYLANLGLLPEAQKKALLYGDWSSFSGQAFPEWRNDAEHYADGLFTHVTKRFSIPAQWKIFRSFDFGYSRPFAVGWYALDGDGRLYRFREYYGWSGSPNVGLRLSPAEIARKIREIEESDTDIRGRRVIGVADPSIFDASRGESVAAMMEKCGVFFSPADNQRLVGKMQVHARLKFDENGVPMFYCFDCCPQFIRTFPALCYGKSNIEDIDTDSEDHIYDEFRYMCMERCL